MSFVPGKSKTKVQPEGSRFQGRYFDDELRLWFDLGDPRDTEAEVRALIAEFNNPDPLVGTCRHCGRRIVKDPEEGWIDPEAGYDDEFGDGMWRTSCDEHDTFEADHEPTYVLHYTSADAPGPDAPWSVYREQYTDVEDEEPIDGSQEHVSTHPNEAAAYTEAMRLQMEGQ